MRSTSDLPVDLALIWRGWSWESADLASRLPPWTVFSSWPLASSLQLTVEEVIGERVHAPLLEDVLLLLELEDLGLLHHFVLVLRREAADGHQRLDLFFELLLLGVHSARSRGRATARDPAYDLMYASSRYRPIPAAIT